MEQFEIRKLRSGGLVLLLQHGALDELHSRIVAPLSTSAKLEPMTRLRPTIDIDGIRHVVLMDRLAAVNRSAIGPVVADARGIQDQVGLALDWLFKGF